MIAFPGYRFAPQSIRRLGRRRRWRGKLGQVGQSENAFDVCDLSNGVLKPIFAELLVFDVFELVIHLVRLFGRKSSSVPRK